MGLRLLLTATLVGVGPSSCASSCQRPTETKVGGDVLATVDGTPLRSSDVEKQAPGATGRPEYQQVVLEELIREQVMSSRALALGLDADPGYKAKMAQLEAQLRAEQRKALIDLLVRKEIDAKVRPDMDAARRYFDEHHEDLRTEVHLQTILRRSEADIVIAQKMLAQGIPFVEVVGGPGSDPFAKTSFDLFWRKLQDVPEEFKPLLATLKPGDVSGVVHHGLDRWYLVRFVEKRQMPDINFDAEREHILTRLKTAEVQRRKKELETELRAKAKIVYAPPDAARPEPPRPQPPGMPQ